MHNKLTVIMSCYNQEGYIQQAVESVLMQRTNFNFTIIIADDHSTKDKSTEIIKEYVDRYPDKIKAILSESNSRYLANILRAKSLVKTDYFCLLDVDDYWTDAYKLQNAYDFLEKNPEYSIYSTNTLCLYENGTQHPLISPTTPNSTYDIADFLTGKAKATQTSGTVFRNVIFKYGIPEIIRNSIGTISERSFEGDLGRYAIHLKHGKALFVNTVDSVYRVLSNGIWNCMSAFEKHVLMAQAFIDYSVYFEDQHKGGFYNRAWTYLRKAGDEMVESINTMQPAGKSHDIYIIFFTLLEKYCSCHDFRHVPSESTQKRAKRLKYRIIKKTYEYARGILKKKGLLNI